MNLMLTLLAQTPTSRPAAPPPGAALMQWFPLILMGIIFYFLLMRPQSKEKKIRQQMLDAVKKNDRVVTLGGIIGTVVSVKDDEITLKVDESSNTKITFLRSAIQRVVSGDSVDASQPAAKS